MPIYEYRCESCGHELDALQKIGDEPLRECPACAETALRRLVSAPRFRLKGGGWYETDFKQSGRRNVVESGDGARAADGKSDGKSEGKGEAKSDTGSDSKPEKKTAAKSAGGTEAAA